MDNLSIYNSVRSVPESALKKIEAGRLRGKSDINPMWRIKMLTENFGICGFGWKYEITDKRLEKGGKDEISAFVDINLYVKIGDEWSAGIPGTGGSSFVANESKGPYMSDECFKMALTDAISVSCKALGIGADVYWEKDNTKYNNKPSEQQKPTGKKEEISLEQITRLWAIAKNAGQSNDDVHKWIKAKFHITSVKDLKPSQYDELCKALEAKKAS